MAAAANVGGLWMGSYSYPEGLGPTTPFLARIEDRDGALSGTIIEPNLQGYLGDSVEAVIRGSRHGVQVDFTKVYDGAADFAHAIDYVGRLSEDGNRISGVWSLEDLDGSFEMYREAVWEEVEEQEAAVVEL